MTGDTGSSHDEDRLDEMVEESFPASDPPSGWAGEDRRDMEARPGRKGLSDQDSDSSNSPNDRMSSRLAE
jgi:hypothetical protein